MPVGHRRRRNGVVGAIHRRGDVREVREGGGRGAARGVGVGWEARRREAAALKHTGDAARRGHGEGAHPVRLGSTSGRRVGAASADQSVDKGLGVGTEAAALHQVRRELPSGDLRVCPCMRVCLCPLWWPCAWRMC